MVTVAPIVACATDVRDELLRVQHIPQRALPSIKKAAR